MLEVKEIKHTVCGQVRERKGFELKNINFSLDAGYLMCLLGKNGSGKTSLLHLLYGITSPDFGSIRWNGQEVYEHSTKVRQEIAFVGEDSIFFEGKTVSENVEVLSSLYPSFSQIKFDEYMNRFGLRDKMSHQKVGAFSTGQKRLIALAFALARCPKLLLLDEPTANLDPVYRVELMEILQALIAKEEISVIISTHILEDIEDIADYIGVMRDGEMILFGDRESLFEEKKQECLKGVILESGKEKNDGT